MPSSQYTLQFVIGDPPSYGIVQLNLIEAADEDRRAKVAGASGARAAMIEFSLL